MEKNIALEQAIADAKALKEAALENAKATIEESVFPELKNFLLNEMKKKEDEEDTKKDMKEESYAKDGKDGDPASEKTYTKVDKNNESKDSEKEDKEEVDENISIDDLLEQIERELSESEEEEDGEKKEMDEKYVSSGIGKGENSQPTKSAKSAHTEDPGKGKYFTKEELNAAIDKVLSTMNESTESDSDVNENEEVESLKAQLDEAFDTIKKLSSALNEINILNSKLLYASKLFRSLELSESQKADITENFDKISTVREAKLLFATYAKIFEQKQPTNVKKISESSAPVASTAPSKEVIQEAFGESDFEIERKRLQKLAGLLKN